MPYASYRERPGAGGGAALGDADVAAFLERCSFVSTPDGNQARELAEEFGAAPETGAGVPEVVAGVDGSAAVVDADGRVPPSQIVFVTVGVVEIDAPRYDALNAAGGPVDPKSVASCFTTRTFRFVLPGRNTKYGDAPGPRDGFRKALRDGLADPSTALQEGGRTLEDTLETLLRLHPSAGDGMPVDVCPSCGALPGVSVPFDVRRATCGTCGETIFLSDCLELADGAGTDDFDAETAANRTMNTIEKLMPAHRTLTENDAGRDPYRHGFLLDGPLALFQKPQNLTRCLQRFHKRMRDSAVRAHREPPVVVGLPKTGELAEHLEALRPHLPDGALKCVDERYRFERVRGSPPKPDRAPFGAANYYGQDFLYAPPGRRHVVALPFPEETRDGSARSRFAAVKNDPKSYPELARALETVRKMGDSRGPDAVVPISKAHEAASISRRDADRLARRAAAAVGNGSRIG